MIRKSALFLAASLVVITPLPAHAENYAEQCWKWVTTSTHKKVIKHKPAVHAKSHTAKKHHVAKKHRKHVTHAPIKPKARKETYLAKVRVPIACPTKPPIETLVSINPNVEVIPPTILDEIVESAPPTPPTDTETETNEYVYVDNGRWFPGFPSGGPVGGVPYYPPVVPPVIPPVEPPITQPPENPPPVVPPTVEPPVVIPPVEPPINPPDNPPPVIPPVEPPIINPPIEQPPSIPEPSSWLMMIIGFGSVGVILRERRRYKVH